MFPVDVFWEFVLWLVSQNSSTIHVMYFLRLKRSFGLLYVLLEGHDGTGEGLSIRTVLKATPGATHDSFKSLLKFVCRVDKVF